MYLQITSLVLLTIELSKFPLQPMLKCSSWNDRYRTPSLLTCKHLKYTLQEYENIIFFIPYVIWHDLSSELLCICPLKLCLYLFFAFSSSFSAITYKFYLSKKSKFWLILTVHFVYFLLVSNFTITFKKK